MPRQRRRHPKPQGSFRNTGPSEIPLARAGGAALQLRSELLPLLLLRRFGLDGVLSRLLNLGRSHRSARLLTGGIIYRARVRFQVAELFLREPRLFDCAELVPSERLPLEETAHPCESSHSRPRYLRWTTLSLRRHSGTLAQARAT